MRRLFGMLTAAALIAGVAVVGVVPASAAPSTEVSPTSGQSGSAVTVTGSGYSPGFSPCLIYIGLTGETAVEIGTCTVEKNGLVSEQIAIPTDLAPNVYTIFICNFCLDPVLKYEFSEVGETTFQVLRPPPPTTTTLPPPTTTTLPPSTTTTDTPTTTTSLPDEEEDDPFPGALPILIDGRAIPRMGPESAFADAAGSPWTPIRITDDLLQIPDYWVLRCGAPPGSQIVDFDDQELGMPAELTSSSTSDTVYFSASSSATSPEVVAPMQGTWTAPYAAQMGIRPSPPDDFSSNAAKIITSSQFTYFGFRIGLADDIDAPVVIELAARAGEGTFWDVDRIELGPTVSPVTTCLMVAAPEGESFREVQLGIYSETDDRVNVLLDSVYWSSVDPYPITPIPDPVEVEIIYPSPSSNLTTARNTSVIGRVTWPESRRLGTVTIATPTWDSTGVVVRRAQIANATTDGQERTAFFWLDAIQVPSGTFELAATATGSSLRGSAVVSLVGIGPPTPPPSEYLDLIEGQVDIIPWAIEVTQAIRGSLTPQAPNSVIGDRFNHVAGKRTVVRGYATHELADSLDIRPGQIFAGAVLHGMRDGVTLPFSPLQPEAASTRLFALGIGEAAEQATRPFAQNTFNFVLPYSWTAEGNIQLRFEVNPPTSPIHIDELPGTDGAQNSIMQQQVTFTDVGRVGVSAVNFEVNWKCTSLMVETEDPRHPCFGLTEGDEVSTTRSADQMRNTTREWWKAFPAPSDYPAYFTYSEINIPYKGDDPRVSVDRTIVGRAADISWEDWRDAYWDLDCKGPKFLPTVIRPASVRDLIWMGLPPWAPFGIAGCAWSNRRSAFLANTFWGTAAQETAHTMGLEHTGNGHLELTVGPAVIRFPGDHGQIDVPGESTSAFDTSSMMVVSAPSGGHVHDFLSYGQGQKWISVGTWNHIFTSLRDNRTFGESRGPVISSGAAGPSEQSGAVGEGQAMIVQGTVNNGVVTIAPVYVGDAGAYFFSEGDDVTITLEGPDGPLSLSVALSNANTHGGNSGQYFVGAFPTDLVGIESMTVLVKGTDPVIIRGEAGDGELRIDTLTRDLISWTAGAAQPPFNVEASDDGGESWWMLGAVDVPELRIDPAVNPLSGDGWVVRVQGSNGPTVLLDTAPIDFGTPKPIAAIGSPLDGDRVRVGMARAFASVGVIGDDGSEYQWYVDGELVNTGTVSDVPIVPGERTITLRVTNATGSDEQSITVNGVIDTDGDGLDDEWEIANGFDPLVPDAVEEDLDGDGVPLGTEYQQGTDPKNPDTDGDGYSDGLEIEGAGDPLDPTVIAGPILGVDDASAFLAAPDVPASDRSVIPVWVYVVAGVAVLAPFGYWLTRRTRGT